VNGPRFEIQLFGRLTAVKLPKPNLEENQALLGTLSRDMNVRMRLKVDQT
jgi:hypothetical protein